MYNLIVNSVSKSFYKYPNYFGYFRYIMFGANTAVEHNAIKDVSFSVKPGEVYGILGVNGSGKMRRLDYMSGMIESYSGLDNIYYKCSLLGMRSRDINMIVEDIIYFQNLEMIFIKNIEAIHHQ